MLPNRGLFVDSTLGSDGGEGICTGRRKCRGQVGRSIEDGEGRGSFRGRRTT